jgi:hypothetical protein
VELLVVPLLSKTCCGVKSPLTILCSLNNLMGRNGIFSMDCTPRLHQFQDYQQMPYKQDFDDIENEISLTHEHQSFDC